jgi:hypothetical protein
VKSLWELLGYDRVAEEIAMALSGRVPVSLIEGPPGIGKSWLARGIGELWVEGGGSVVLAEGDALKRDASLHPFDTAMSGLPRAWRSVAPTVAGVAMAGEALLGTGGLITSTIKALAASGSARRREKAVLLDVSEQAVLHAVERLAKDRPMLLIADNLHWWDRASIVLLARLTGEPMARSFPFLQRMRILAVETSEPYQSIAHVDAHDTLITPSCSKRFPLQRVPRDGFESVLEALGATPSPPSEIADLIYSFSGGHLALASRCASRIAEGDTASFTDAANAQEFIGALLTERIRSLGESGREAVELLKLAAVVGRAFRVQEVSCVSGQEQAATRRVLRYCQSEGIIEAGTGSDRFVHDLYRQHFLELAARARSEIHARLGECLRELRPGDYELRCLNAIEGDEHEEAARLAVQLAIQRKRDGSDRDDLPALIADVIDDADMAEVVRRFEEAIEALSEYRFDDCFENLDLMPRRIGRPLAAEADYLRAMCLMSTRSEVDRATARATLDAWDGYEGEEPELGTRLMVLLLYGLFHVRDKSAGWELEGRLQRALSGRAPFDQSAEDALCTLDRCSGGLHPVDVALRRCRRSARHFGPRPGVATFRRPLEYYRCQVNLVANLIGCAEYEEAAQKHVELDTFLVGFDVGTFPRVEYARMNGVLADYRRGAIDATEAVDRQREVATSAASGDPFYPDNALAVYLALAGEYANAVPILDRLDGMLAQSRSEPEPSMVYLIRSNRCAIRYVMGDSEMDAEWRSLTAIAEANNYVDRDATLLRHTLLADVLAAGTKLTAVEFDEFLPKHRPGEFGPFWNHAGLGFMLPAIEFWREN